MHCFYMSQCSECMSVRWEGGSVANLMRSHSHVYLHFSPNVKTHTLSTGVMYCSTLHLASLPVAYHHIQHTSNHALLAASNQLCVEGTGRQSWFSHGKLAMVCVNDIH